MENQETRGPVTTSIQRRLDLILSQVLLKLDLVIQRDLGKLNLSKYNSKTDESQPLKKKPQQSKKNEMESENREPTPPFLASISLDDACPGSRPPQVQLAKLPPPQTTTVSPDRDSHVLPLNPSMPSSTTPVIPPSFSSPSPTPIADSNISPTPVQPPLDLVPSHPAYPKRPLEQDFELPSASVGPSLSRKKAKKKRKSKLRQEPAGGGRGMARYEAECQTMGNLVRWGQRLPPRPSVVPPLQALEPGEVMEVGHHAYYGSFLGPSHSPSSFANYPNAYYSHFQFPNPHDQLPSAPPFFTNPNIPIHAPFHHF